MKVSEIIRICEGRVLQRGPEHDVRSLTTDSRKVSNTDSSIFFAIKGHNHDGHRFIADMARAGVKTFVIESESGISPPPDVTVIQVASSLKAIQQLATFKRSQFEGPVVGITGSNGKTIVKEWLAKMLSLNHRVVKSPRSYNSQLGVPLSVWEVSPEFDIGVFEAGISTIDEMATLQGIIRPTHGIFTNIGTAHEEGFESMRAKTQEKLKLFSDCEYLVYRADMALIRQEVTHALTGKTRPFSWAFDHEADLQVTRKAQGYYEFNLEEDSFLLKLPFTDAASEENLIHCIAFLHLLGKSPEEIQEALNELEPVDMRLKLHKGVNQTYIIDDSYNNDLAGLETALDFLLQQKQQDERTVILSDLPQVSDKAALYTEVSRFITEKAIDRIIAIGPELSTYLTGIEAEALSFGNTNEFLQALPQISFQSEIILIKGARKFQFERIVRQLSEQVHQTVFEINLDAITHNLNYYRKLLKPGVKTMVMVKAFAYGSGSAEIAQLLQFHKVHYLSVAYADEGVTLRKNGIHLPIMVMNTTSSDLEALITHQMEPEIFSQAQLVSFSEYYQQRGEQLPIHININTGMNRLGFEEQEIDVLINHLSSHDHIGVKSVFTHLAGADETQHNDFSIQQLEQFARAAKKLEEGLGTVLTKHALNSAGIQRFPQYQFDMVRLGIGLYGLEASGMHEEQLMTVGTLKTVVSQIKEIKAGETIGYGRKGVASDDMQIATVAIGYADGFTRAFSSGVGQMKVRDQLVPVIGNVCMDMTMLDVTGLNVQAGDEVIVFGDSPTISELATQIHTIPYEILTNVSTRVKRVYLIE